MYTDKALTSVNKAIELNPNDAVAYYNRSVIHIDSEDYLQSLKDANKAIELNPNLAQAHYVSAEAWIYLNKWENAKSQLTIAKKLGFDIAAAFRRDHISVTKYEKRNRTKLPKAIAELLTERRRSRYTKVEKQLLPNGETIENPQVLELKTKLNNVGTPLAEYVGTAPYFGLDATRQEAFIINSTTRKQLIAEHPISEQIIKPFIHFRDAQRWHNTHNESIDAHLIFSYRDIEIDRYPAIKKHLEPYRAILSNRKGKQKWYELNATLKHAQKMECPKLVSPNLYNHQTFAVDTNNLYCANRYYIVPTTETWLCGLLNSKIIEWIYSQQANQLTGDFLKVRTKFMNQLPIPDLTEAQKSLFDKFTQYLIYIKQHTETKKMVTLYFERIVDGLAYEAYLGNEMGKKQFFQPLLDEQLPDIEDIQENTLDTIQTIFDRLYERHHPVRRNLFFIDSVKPVRTIEGKT